MYALADGSPDSSSIVAEESARSYFSDDFPAGCLRARFSSRADFPTALARRFTQAMLAMDYQQPEQKRIMDLEGLTRWVPGRTEGYQELEDEARELNLLS